MKANVRRFLCGAAVLCAMAAYGQNGADVYRAKCAMCHAADGTANSPAGKAMGTPSLLDAKFVKETDADLIAVTKNGKGKMPAYNGKLSDVQIKDAVAYIRTLQKR